VAERIGEETAGQKLITELVRLALFLFTLNLYCGDWTVEVDRATLACTGRHSDGRRVEISSPQTPAEPFTVEPVENGVRIRFQTTAPGLLHWPQLARVEAESVALPLGEGFYVPLAEARWRRFLVERSPMHTMQDLSLPAWGLRHKGFTVVYILESPFDNALSWQEFDGKLQMSLTHRIQRNQPRQEFSLLVKIAGDSPIETAKVYRQWHQQYRKFVTLREKIAATPAAERLLGAAHLYLWATSRLTAADVVDWRGLYAAVRGGKPPPYVSAADKRDLLAANEQTLEPFLRPAAERGSAISPRMLQLLHDAGLDRLWLGAPGREIELLAQNPGVAKLAQRYGYLLAPYDSYHSIHSPTEKESWATAQFDRALYERGAIVDEAGRKSSGFQGKGFHLSSLAAAPYVKQRVERILGQTGFTSWFVDCDATGELFDNYAAAFPHTQEDDMNHRLDRLTWLARDKQLVVGSEGGAWFASPVIHFAHGMLTPLFGWKDPLLRNPESKYFPGRYWPPEAPALFFKATVLPESYKEIYFDPRYRLPLYQTAFHDSVIATSHWTVSTLKFTNVRRMRELLELLYGVPPLYHLNRDELAERLALITPHYAEFTQLHREIGLLPMTDFQWLNEERTRQKTVFGGKIAVIVDFKNERFEVTRF